MKYLIFAALLMTSLGAAVSSNKITKRTAEGLTPLYYCDRCGELVADMGRHLPNCPGKSGN